MKLRLLKLCSLVLTVVMLFNLLPHQAIALNLETAEQSSANDTVTSLNDADAADEAAAIVAEVTENRTEFSKEYKLSNGLHMAIVYPEAVHYEEDGQWKDIDNTLKAVGSGSAGTYTNTAGAWNAEFPQQLSKSNRVSITKDGYTVSFGMAGEIRRTIRPVLGGELATASIAGSVNTDTVLTVEQMQTAPAQVQELDYSLAKASAEHPEIVRDKLQSRLVYNDVYDNTNIIYDLNSYQLKESIVISSFNAAVQGYRYTLETGTLVPVLNDNGSIDLFAPDSDEVIMTMPAPYMIDDAGVTSTDVAVSLVRSGAAYILTYTMPMTWLAEADRQWPVVLDPVIEAVSHHSNIRDQFVAEYYSEPYDHGTMYCGYYTYYGKMRTFIRYVDIPPLSSADVVVNASLSLLRHGGTSETTTVEAHKVNGTWDSTTITWANQPAYDPIIEDYAQVGGNGRYSWEITDIVRNWYTSSNTGVMLKASDTVEAGSAVSWKKFYTIDYDVTDPSTWPYLYITFRNSNGIEDYWDYTASSAGRAGTGYVNNYSGNLTWVHSDIGFGGNRMPVTISHVYNTNDCELNTFGLGYGWRTNFNQTATVWDQNSNYYVWTDGDGTKHYFLYESAGIYKDEDGLELTLTVSGNDKTITDKYGNTSHFDSEGRLHKLQNNQQTPSSITITYQNSTSKLISKITDGAGRVYNFTYPDGLLTRISYVGKGSRELAYISFGYTGSQLTSITDQDGEISQYTYDSGNILTTAQDIDGYKLQYTYSTGSPKRVVGISEYDDTVAGGSMAIEYAHNQTTFTDHNNNIQILQFNDWGNVISIQDGEGRAQYAQYARNDFDNSSAKANQLRLSSKLQNTVGNRNWNASFEWGDVWTLTSDSVTQLITTEEAYIGNRSLKVTTTDSTTPGGVSRNLRTPGKTITISAYLKTDSTTSAYLTVEDATQVVTSEILGPGSDWTRIEVSLTQANSTPNDYLVKLLTTAPGTVYMDCVQIESAETASRYNLIENGDLQNFTAFDLIQPAYWTKSSTCTSDDVGCSVTAAAPTLMDYGFTFTGDPNAEKYITQTIAVSGGEGDTYVLSGWAKGKSAPLTSEERKFGLKLIFNNTDGSQTPVEISFNPAYDSLDNWQYAATPAVATAAYSSITVQVCYSYNVNTVYFDGIQLYKEEFGNSYTYDDNGNIKSVVDLQKQRTEYEYTANDLTKIIQAGNTQMTYTYDNWHNVKTATTASGEVYEFTYDTYGNNTKVEIKNGEQVISSTATYSADGNILVSTTDALAKTTTYSYNENTNVLEWVQYPNDTESTRTEYTYDTMYRLAAATADVDSGYTLTASYTYTDDMLTKIETGSTTYSFSYGDFAQRSSIQIGSRTLATYSYTADANRYLSALNYGNGDSVQYTYDDYGRVIQQTYEDGSTVTYSYDNMGALATVTDSATGRKTTYYYDLTDRLMKYVETGTGYSHSAGYEYDSRNNLTKLVETINGVEHTTSYAYDENDRLTETAYGSIAETVQYDGYGRMYITRLENNGSTVLGSWFQYASGATGTADTTRLAAVQVSSPAGYTLGSYYSYDDNGNITRYNLAGFNELEEFPSEDGPARMGDVYYHYDTANQLVREDNIWLNRTTVWTYDDAGNITSRKLYPYTSRMTAVSGDPLQTYTYTYGDSAWGDLLTAYNGVQWSYDQIGNLTNDGTWTYTWRNGRELASMTSGSTTWTYTYDANGMRTSRSNGSTTYTYVYNGSQLTQMTRGTDTLYFTYGAIGPTTVTWNGVTYYYAVNAQGDVMGIFDAAGNCVVTYNWDNAWGCNPAPEGTLAATLGQLNPLRYRSYVYDTETDLYYLNTRYYNPEIGRFINADNYPSTGQGLTGNNMFAYCGNNPVSRADDCGEFWNFVIGAAVGAVIGIVTTAVDAVKEDGWDALTSGKTWAKMGVSAVCGAINGVVAASGAHVLVGGLVGAATGFVESVSHELIDNDGKMSEESWGAVATDSAVGLLGGLAGGHGAMHGNKYMAQQTTRLVKHIATDSVKKAGSFYLKMTVNYSKQFIKPTLAGIAKGWVGGKVANHGLSLLVN